MTMKLNIRHLSILFRRQIASKICSYHRSCFYCQSSLLSQTSKPKQESYEWNNIISDAETIVGYPTSFMYLRCLQSEEIANVALHAKKLIGTKHPLLKTARGLLYNDKHGVQIRGLIVLLISKAAMSKHCIDPAANTELISGIDKRQRTLAEITDMIHTAYLIHKGVVNVSDVTPTDGPVADIEFGNKISVLSGDFLLANACTGLAQLRNTKVVEMISSAIGNLTESRFAYDTTHNATLADWLRHTYLSSCCLLAKSCQSALALTDHSQDLQKRAFDFGVNMAYALQMFSIVKDASEFGHLAGEIRELVTHYSTSAEQDLEGFSESQAKTTLLRIVKAVDVNTRNDSTNIT